MALNAGSSSVKFALFGSSDRATLPVATLRGSLTGEDTGTPHFRVSDATGAVLVDERWRNDGTAAWTERLIGWIEEHLGDAALIGVGHRVVHGGRDFVDPVRIDDEVLLRLDALTPLAPLHQPASLAPIRQLRQSRPDLPQFACFDTAFHHGLLPPVSRYPLPRALEEDGIRRYGFHGLSYEAIAAKLRRGGRCAPDERVIVAHLGSGASLCAMRNLASVDTTMGFTALDGVMMGTRPGTLDPGILLYLMQAKGYDASRIEHLLYHESGLLGVSGISSDVETLLASDAPEAREALDLFAFLIARQAAALMVTLGGVDRFVFTGGVGEHAWQIRRSVIGWLGWTGCATDEEANRSNKPVISPEGGGISVETMETDEEAIIAGHAIACLNA
ncbi:acetate/propionate family kinase [Sphingomonas sp. PAMC26645]|nr:acetate/propionate family kinase [Sphingomonas sp. PAMC26645]